MILNVSPKGSNNRLHMPWHTFVERFEENWQDLSQIFSAIFSPLLLMLHNLCFEAVLFESKQYNVVQIEVVSRPTIKKVEALFYVPLPLCSGAMYLSAIFYQ